MNKKIFRRLAAAAVTLVVAAGSVGMLAACSSDYPEVTITYKFNDTEYEVEYVLYRHDAPQTVNHFIELADAGYYDGQNFVVHDFTENYMMTGGYTINAENDLEEVDYFAVVKQLEKDLGMKFTQSVWEMEGTAAAPQKGEGLYTVYGEATSKITVQGAENTQGKGALVMYYSDKGNFQGQVTVERHDGGKNNNGEPLQYEKYSPNSATALFYTQLAASMTSDDTHDFKDYCVFGKVKKESTGLDDLLAAIDAYKETLDDEETFTQEDLQTLNTLEHEQFDLLKQGKQTATFEVPMNKPIYLLSVKVTKY